MRKTIVIVMALAAMLLTCNMASAAKVAIYVWSGANSEYMLSLFRAVEATGNTPYGISSYDIEHDRLTTGDFKVLILPAGDEDSITTWGDEANATHLSWEPKKYNDAFTEDMKNKVRAFVQAGGGFVGIELGAYFASYNYGTGLQLYRGEYRAWADLAPGQNILNLYKFYIVDEDFNGPGDTHITQDVFMSANGGDFTFTDDGKETVVVKNDYNLDSTLDDPVAIRFTGVWNPTTSSYDGTGHVVLTSLELSLRGDSEEDWTIWDNYVNNNHTNSQGAWKLLGRMINWAADPTLTGPGPVLVPEPPDFSSSDLTGNKVAVISTYGTYKCWNLTYDGGAWPGLIPAVGKSIDNAGHTPLAIRLADVSSILTFPDFSAVVFPGGSAWGYRCGLTDADRNTIQNFVSTGGGYLGICAGSFFGATEYDYDFCDGAGLTTIDSLNLGLFAGKDVGPISDIANYCPDNYTWALADIKVNDAVLDINKPSQKQFYYGGGYKTGITTETTVSHYNFNGEPDAIRFTYGDGEQDGHVLLIGTHPEVRSGNNDDWLHWDNFAYGSTSSSPDLINPDNPWDFIDAAFNKWLIPKTVVLLLDTSGSMSWDYNGNVGVSEDKQRLTLAKNAVLPFMDQLPPPVQFGIVRFPKYPYDSDDNCKAEVIKDSQTSPDIIPVTDDNIIYAKNAIQNLVANGGTPMIAGLKEAIGKFKGAGLQAIVMLSDGYHNCPEQIAADDLDNENWMNDLKDKGIRVFTIGFSEAGDTDGRFLNKLAQDTDGYYEDETGSPNPQTTLAIAYNKILAKGLGLEQINDPMGVIDGGTTATHKVAINEHDRKVSFLLSWVTPEKGRLGLTLKSSDNVPIKTVRNPGVRVREGRTYKIITVDSAFLQQPGKVGSDPWTIEITGSDNIPDGEPEHYQYSIIADSKLKMTAVLGQPRYKTGDVVKITARIKEQGQPLTHLDKAQVQITRPTDGSGNWFAANKVTERELAKVPANLSNENLPRIQRKAKFLTDIRKVAYPGRSGPVTLSLYDDGTHGDANAGDGIFTIQFSDTFKEGTYSFYVRVSGSTGAGNKFEREQMIQKYITVNAKPKYLIAEIVSVGTTEDNVHGYAITATPKDALGNYLGPGHSGIISMSASKGTFVDGLKDNLDGSYTRKLNLPAGVDAQDVNITVGVRGEDLTFNLAEKIQGRYGISFHLGRAVPRGNFDNDYDPGHSVGVNVEYRLSPQFLVQGLIGYNHFDAGSSLVSDTYWWNISANLKYEITTTRLRPYILGGAGIYFPKSGSTEPGYNIGLGLDYSLSPDWTVEVGVDYNHIFTSGSDTKFVVPNVGVIYKFY